MRRKCMICNHPADIHMRNLQQKADMGKKIGSESTTRFPQVSCFKKTHHVCQKGDAHMRYKKMGQRNWIPVQLRKAQRI